MKRAYLMILAPLSILVVSLSVYFYLLKREKNDRSVINIEPSLQPESANADVKGGLVYPLTADIPGGPEVQRSLRTIQEINQVNKINQ